MNRVLAVLFAVFACHFLGHANAQYSPVGSSVSTTPTFSWPATSGASSYGLFVAQQSGLLETWVDLSPTQVGCAGGGTCSITLTALTPASGNGPFQIPFVAGKIVSWWIESYDASGGRIATPGQLMFTPKFESTTDFNQGWIDVVDPQPCTKWFYVSDFIAQTRRVIDFSVGSGTNYSGYQSFRENSWVSVDISDLVPSTARAARISAEIISSATNGDMIGWSTRRTGSAILNIPSAPLRYIVAPKGDLRASVEITVLLNNGKFDFLWSHVVNGIDYAAVNGSTVTGRAINASLVGYCTP